jgi:DNA polymerase III epsilon subunit-like protein
MTISTVGSMESPYENIAWQDDGMRIIKSSNQSDLTNLQDEVTLPHDVYFSADIETDGAIPGPNSILSIGITYAGTFDGETFSAPVDYNTTFYRELKPISDEFDPKALEVNGLDRDRLKVEGTEPEKAMTQAAEWITKIAGAGDPVLVAYPLSFDWSWLYWYFVRFSKTGSPFGYSRCFDIKTAIAVKYSRTIVSSGRERIPSFMKPDLKHSHHALDDAIEQAMIFSKLFIKSGK